MAVCDEGCFLGLVLIYPQIGVLHKVFLLLAVVVLRHRPEIEILILSGIPLGVHRLLLGAGCLVAPFVLGQVGVSPSVHHLVVLHPHHLRPQFLVLLDEVLLLLRMLVDLGTLLVNFGCHFLYFLLQLAVLAVDLDDYLFIGLVRP